MAVVEHTQKKTHVYTHRNTLQHTATQREEGMAVAAHTHTNTYTHCNTLKHKHTATQRAEDMAVAEISAANPRMRYMPYLSSVAAGDRAK